MHAHLDAITKDRWNFLDSKIWNSVILLADEKRGYFETDPTRQNFEQSPRPAETQWIILISGLVAL